MSINGVGKLLKNIWKIIFWIFVIIGFYILIDLYLKLINTTMVSEICGPRMMSAVDAFIEKVIKEHKEKLRNVKPFSCERTKKTKEAVCKRTDELIKLCKRDFSTNYSILSIPSRDPCYKATFYVKFKKSIYLFKLVNTIKPSYLCRCPEYEVVFVDRKAICGK